MSWTHEWWSEAEDSVTWSLNLIMYELGMTSALEEERMGAASPWMV